MNNINDILDGKAKDLFKDNPIPSSVQPEDNEGGTDTTQGSTSNEVTQSTSLFRSEPEQTPSPAPDMEQIRASVYTIKNQLDSLLRMIDGKSVKNSAPKNLDSTILSGGERIIEGVFTGDKMMGQDGEEYSVPPNYASKSKLVEGDIMKLTIAPNGSFIYKQIQPIARKRVTGQLSRDEAGNWSALYNGKAYKILTASATFYKGNPGDDVIMFIPEDEESSWGAMEHIIHK